MAFPHAGTPCGANKYTAENVNWPQLKAAFEDSPWFQEHCPIVDEGKRVALDKDNCVSLPKNIAIQLGSNEKHALGKAVIWGVVDEANFQSENSHQAYNSYNAIAQRRTSRFQDADTALKLFYYFSKKRPDKLGVMEVVRTVLCTTITILQNLGAEAPTLPFPIIPISPCS